MFKFEYDVKIRTEDVDKNDFLTPTALLSMFQDAAGEHAYRNGFGYENSLKQNMFWMVVRNKIELLRQPTTFETLHLVTWPEKPGKIETNRNYLLLDKDGEIVAKGSSKWVNVDVNTRRLVRAMKMNVPDEEYVLDKVYDDLPKIEDFEVDENKYASVKTRYTDLDHNGHVNNIKYADYILDGIASLQNKEFTSFEINYIKEVPANSEVKIYYVENDKEFKIKGKANDVLCFIAIIKIK